MNLIKRAFENSIEQEFISGAGSVSKLSLDELYAEAQRLGEVEIGGAFYPKKATIKLPRDSVCGDFVHVQCKKHDDIKQNLSDCIHRARKIVNFYTSLQGY